MIRSFLLCSILLLDVFCGKIKAGNEENEFLTQQQMLANVVELKDAQEGFSGQTGEVLTVQPTGAWEIARFYNKEKERPHRRGHLTQSQLVALAEIFKENEFSRLPTNAGREFLKINRHLVTVSFGSKRATLILSGREDPVGYMTSQKFSAHHDDAGWKIALITQSLRRIVESSGD